MLSAVAAASADGKPVLLDIGGSTCSSCKALDRAMHSPKAQAVLAQSYHVVKIDPGGAGPMNIAFQYYASATNGMPLLVVLNPDGTVRGDSAHNGQPSYDEAGVTAWLKQWAR
jgi:uncharacterized protein YyaL (SSP411 family)